MFTLFIICGVLLSSYFVLPWDVYFFFIAVLLVCPVHSVTLSFSLEGLIKYIISYCRFFAIQSSLVVCSDSCLFSVVFWTQSIKFKLPFKMISFEWKNMKKHETRLIVPSDFNREKVFSVVAKQYYPPPLWKFLVVCLQLVCKRIVIKWFQMIITSNK